MPHQHIELLLGDAHDSQARVYLRAISNSTVVSISGRLHGPRCDYARTLAADYPLRPLPGDTGEACLAEALVLDPCYWTPALPFQYELEIALTTRSGETIDQLVHVGLRRWAAEGANLRLERRRTVLRGCRVDLLAEQRLPEARSAETALLVDPPNLALCAAANRQGVPLLVDLRQTGEHFESELARFAWSPATMMVLATAAQLDNDRCTSNARRGLLTGQWLTPDALEAQSTAIPCDAFAIELGTHESPPAWLANCGKPVIAIRRGQAYADLATARTACDHLQTALAPKFNLAGYFVAP